MKFLSRTNLPRIIFAILIPIAAWILQAAFWPILSPYVWFLFFPAVFFSAWIGGLPGGAAAAVLSSLIVWWYFIPPAYSFEDATPSGYFSIIIFLAMGILFGYTQERLKQANARAAAALSAAQLANEQLLQANTQITHLYDKNRELDHLKSQFFANVSHELRTPLTLILGPVSNLLAEANFTAEQKRSLEVIQRNARLLYRHVSDLLDVAKLESKKMELRYIRTDLSQLSRFVASHFEVLAADKQIQFTVELPNTLPAEVDSEKCQRILFNLLSNAFKFTPHEGVIRLSLAQAGAYAYFQIADSGPGISPEMREVIFERFRQVESGADRRYGGTGLGLTIVKEFTASQGGEVQVSEAPGGGSLFTVKLPLSAPAGTEISASVGLVDKEISRQLVEELRPAGGTVLPAGSPGNAALVLVVEDNPDMNAFIASSLNSRFRVVSAFDGNEGLRMALNERPDLIIADVMMPALSGDQMVSTMRQSASLSDVPIVMLTAKADDELRVTFLKDMVQDFLYKPFSVAELLVRVSRLITERAHQKNILHLSDERFIKAFNANPAGIFISTLSDGIIIAANDHAVQILGYERSDLIGHSALELNIYVDPEARARIVKSLETQKSLGGYELKLRTKTGEIIQSLVSYESIDLDGERCLLSNFFDNTARKRIEQDLKESEARLMRAQSAAHVGNWEYSLADHRMWASEEAFRIYGIERTSPYLQLAEAQRLVTADDRPCLDKALRELIEKRLPYNLEFRMKRANDGAERVIHSQAFLECDDQDQPLKVIGVLQDITERKQVEEALIKSEANLRALIENTDDIIASRDRDGRAIVYNESFRRIVRALFDVECVPGLRTTDYMPAAQKAHWEGILARVRAGEKYNEEFSQEIEGDIRFFELSLNPISAEGKIIGTAEYTHDITARKQAEEDLRRSEERWQFALEGPGDGVWDWDVPNNQIYFSPRWKAMLGYLPEEIGGTLSEWDIRLHPDDREATYAALNQYMDGKTPAYISEHRLKCKDGRYLWVLDRGKVVSRTPEGKILRVIGTHTDITERKQVEAQLREQLAELRRWHAVMLGRETRVIELKNEVNQLLSAAGQSKRYADLQGPVYE